MKRPSPRTTPDFLNDSFQLRLPGLDAAQRDQSTSPQVVPQITLGQPETADPTIDRRNPQRGSQPTSPGGSARPAPRDRRDESSPTTTPTPFDSLETARHELVVNGQRFWLDGNAILCACPDCRAPMTVRQWLGLADCWRCQCSLELSVSVLNELDQWLPRPSTVDRSIPPTSPLDLVPAAERAPSTAAFDAAWPVAARDERWRELERLTRRSSAGRWIQQALDALPAWVLSFLAHVFLILILALIVFQRQSTEAISLVLSTFLDASRTEGGEVRIENPNLQLADDSLPAPDAVDPTEQAKADAQAETDAAELTQEVNPLALRGSVEELKQSLAKRSGPAATFAARDPRIRAEIVQKEGGTTQTEAAVARGLRWLASVQNRDGSWSLANYDRHARSENRGDAAATSLALLPFLGAGQTPDNGIYRQTVARGLLWLVEHQKSDGDLRANFTGQAGMYAHGQASIVLCEAYAMTGDERLRSAAQKAVEFIEAAQHSGGGWRYQPGTPGDTSILGWQLMALQSARASSGTLNVSQETLDLSDYFLDTVSRSRGRQNPAPDGALYRYLPEERQFTPSMTAEGLLCRVYLGWKRDDPRLMHGVEWLLDNHLPSLSEKDIYYWYYGTQLMHHYGGSAWKRWNNALRDRLVSLQETSGKHPGSWNPRQFVWGPEGERIFVTSLAVCTLEVYYRHLPLFVPIDLSAPSIHE